MLKQGPSAREEPGKVKLAEKRLKIQGKRRAGGRGRKGVPELYEIGGVRD